MIQLPIASKNIHIVDKHVKYGNYIFDIKDINVNAQKLKISKTDVQLLLNAVALNMLVPENFDELMTHENWEVRELVAICGLKKHKDFLTHDSNPHVRAALLKSGDIDYIKILANDPDVKVRQEASLYVKRNYPFNFIKTSPFTTQIGEIKIYIF